MKLKHYFITIGFDEFFTFDLSATDFEFSKLSDCLFFYIDGVKIACFDSTEIAEIIEFVKTDNEILDYYIKHYERGEKNA